MSIIIRLQNLPWTANAEDIRRYFDNLVIPDGGVHIIGGEHGDAFIVFGSDEDARLAMMKDGGMIKNTKVKLLLSSRVEMQKVIDAAKQQALTSQTLIQTLAAASQFDPNSLPIPMLPNMLSMLPALRNLPGLSAMSAMPPTPSIPAVPAVSTLPTMTTMPMPVPAPSVPSKPADPKPAVPVIMTQPSVKDVRSYGDKKDDAKLPSQSRSRSESRSRSRSRSRDRRSHRDRYKRDRSRDRKYRRDRSRSKGRDNGSRSRSRDRYRKRSRSRDRKSRDQNRDRDKDYNYRSRDRRHDSDVKKSADSKEKSPSKDKDSETMKLDHDTTRFKPIPEVQTIKSEKIENPPIARLTDDPKLSFKMFSAPNKQNASSPEHQPKSVTDAAKSQTETKNHVQTPEMNSLPTQPDQNMVNWWAGMMRPQMMPTWMMPQATAKPDGSSEAEKNSKNANNQAPNVPPMPFGMYPFGQGFPHAPGAMYPFAGTYPGAAVQPGMPINMPYPSVPNVIPTQNSPMPNAMPATITTMPNAMPTANAVPMTTAMSAPNTMSGLNSSASNPMPAPNRSIPSVNCDKNKPAEEITDLKRRESKLDSETECDSFGRQRRRTTRRFDSYSPPDDRNAKNYDSNQNNAERRRDGRRSRFDNAYDTRKYDSSRNSIDNEDSRSSRTNYEDRRNADDRRHPDDRRYSEDRRRPDDLGSQDDSYSRRNPYRRNYNRFDDYERNESHTPSSDHSSSRLNYIYNSEIQTSTCVELQNVPLAATVADVKKFLAPLPLFESCIKFQSENEDHRSRSVFIKFINVNQKDQALQQSGFILGHRIRIVDLPVAKYEAAEKVSPVIQVDQQHMKIDFIPKRARTEDIRAAFSDKLEEVLLTKVKDREALVAYLKFSDAGAAQKALRDKHIMICDGRVKLEAISEEDFLKNKSEISEVNGQDTNANLENNDPVSEKIDNPPKRMRVDDELTKAKPQEEVQESKPEENVETIEQPESGTQPLKSNCVSLKYLPPEVTDKEIVEFFSRLHILPAQIHIMFNADYKQTGESYCEFRSEEDAETALGNHQTLLRDRPVSVILVPKEEVTEAIGVPTLTPLLPFEHGMPQHPNNDVNGPVPEISNPMAPPPHRLPPRPLMSQGQPQKPASIENFGNPGCVLALENVPFRADVGDIIKFFGFFGIVKENVIRRFNERGMPTGDFRVCLRTPAEAHKAARMLNGRKIMDRFVSVTVL